MKHWLRKLLPKNEIATGIAQKIEEADERISNLKEQIIAVQARRAELEEEARSIALDCIDEGECDRAIASNEAPLLASCKVSASILQGELRRLFVESSPFLSELAQPEMDKATTIHDNVVRWLSRF
ncbi:hypothetical protein [Pseudomonas sp. NPDC089569]|uniref:hypothetical protein n=1 Tax=Pseudomonas sp. NPDC089569 TaxID=3390722 RepID=UPI003CFF547E